MTLAEEVLARVKPVKFAKSWHDRLPPNVAAELDRLREQYQRGELGEQNLTRLAVAITESLEARGHEMPKAKQVAVWLNEKR